jgi:methylated-DNA-[protein]-cysteine S-methyltransferase
VQLLTDEIPSVLGTIVVVASAGRLCAVDYDDCRDRIMRSLAARYESVHLVAAPDPFGFSGAIRAYLAGRLDAVDALPVETGGTAFQRDVWAALRSIPAGRTITYSELARTVGRPAAVRAAGAANGRNPLAIVVPCHRVIGMSRSLTGYAGGLARKHWLLAHEGAVPRSAATPLVLNLRGGIPSILTRPND